jgi:uncharacterized protein RhaS with RHS repeats
MNTFNRILIIAAFSTAVLCGIGACSQDEDQDASQQPQASEQQVSDNQVQTDESWLVTSVTPSGLVRTYTTDGTVTYDDNVHAYYFEDKLNGDKRTYVSDANSVTMVEQ